METQDGSTRKIYGLRHIGAVGVQQFGESVAQMYTTSAWCDVLVYRRS